jgi:hypothetical protein
MLFMPTGRGAGNEGVGVMVLIPISRFRLKKVSSRKGLDLLVKVISGYKEGE